MTAPALPAAPDEVASHHVKGFAHRPALDGLRGVAVLAVLVYHLRPGWLPGGFLGVDTFFVLSGYLITSLLLVEHQRHGRIRLAQFWARRARRLLPAMIVLVSAVGVWAALVADEEVRASVRDDALAALAYVANWRFVLSGQSYFDEFSEPSPLRHTWSLAIEEQFYLLWPLAVVVCLVLARRRTWLLSVVALVGVVVSAVLMWQLSGADPSRAYYGTDTRVHQMLVGVLLALLLRHGLLRAGGPLDRGATVPWFRAGAWLAAAAIAFALVAVPDGSDDYYRGGSLLFAVAVVALIAGLERGGGGAVSRLLSGRGLVWVGTVSYGLYLYHWPVLLWVTESTVPFDGLALDAVRVLITLAAATLSFYALETPVRRGRLAGVALTARGTLVMALVAMLACGGLVWGLNRDAAPPAWVDGEVGDVVVLGDDDPEALTVAVVGDSIAKSILPGIEVPAREDGVKVVAAAWSGCGYTGAYQLEEDGTTPFDFSQACVDAVPARYLDMVREHDPDVVFLHSVRDRLPLRPAEGGEVLRFGTPEHDALYLEGLGRSIDVLSSEGATVMVSHVVHRGQRFKGTCSRPDQAERCAADDGSDGIYDHVNELVDRAVAQHPGQAEVYRLEDQMCPAGPPCPSQLPGSQDYIRWDGSHLSEPGTEYYGPRILDDLVAAATGTAAGG